MKFYRACLFPGEMSSQKGAILSEFLICIPVLLMLWTIGSELNERLAKKQLLRIAARNAAFLPHIDQDAGKSLAKDFSLNFDPSNGGAAYDDNYRVRIFINNVKASISPSSSDYADRIGLSFTEKISDGQGVNGERIYNALSNGEGVVAKNATPILEGIKNFGVGSHKLFTGEFLTKVAVNHIRVRPSLTQKTIDGLANMVVPAAPGTATAASTVNDNAISFYARKSAGNHPDGYQYQALLAAFLGSSRNLKYWHTKARRDGPFSNSFINACMMHFMADSNCERRGTWFSHTMRIALALRSYQQIFATIFTLGGAEAAAQVGKATLKRTLIGLSQSAGEQIMTRIQDQAGEQLRQMVNPEDMAASFGIRGIMSQFDSYQNILSQDVDTLYGNGMMSP